MSTSPLRLSALESGACAHATSVGDPLVTAGGAHRPLGQEHYFALGQQYYLAPPNEEAATLALLPSGATWLTLGVGSHRASVRLRALANGAHVVAALPADDGGLVLLDRGGGCEGCREARQEGWRGHAGAVLAAGV